MMALIAPLIARVGVRGLVTIGLVLAIPAAYWTGGWRERAATEVKIEAARLALIHELTEQGHAKAAEALRAGRAAADDFDRGRVSDDPNCRDC